MSSKSSIKPVTVDAQSSTARRFYPGQVLEKGGSHIIVLSTDECRGRVTVVHLNNPERAPFEATTEWVVDWFDAILAGPRLIELLPKGEGQPIWREYVPSFEAAVALARCIESIEGNPFKIAIHAQNAAELEYLDHLHQMKYYGPEPNL